MGVMKPLVEFENVSFAYADQMIISGLNLALALGERKLLIAPSGVGKTTLLYLAAGLLKPQIGQVTFNAPRGIAVMFQEDRLLPYYNAIQNVAYMSRCGFDRAGEVLCQLGLGDVLERNVTELSGGMKRRVALARAIMQKSDVILLDEPFKGLDEVTVKVAEEVLLSYQQERSVLMISPCQVDSISSFSLVSDCASWFRFGSA